MRGGGPEPVLGFSSKTAAVLALHREGLSAREIASRIGTDTKSVSALRLMGERAIARAIARRVAQALGMPVALERALAPHAARRSISSQQLAVMLIEAIAADDMVDAILDDGDEVLR